jgi:tetratricopeptide (TPR) repeat protein
MPRYLTLLVAILCCAACAPQQMLTPAPDLTKEGALLQSILGEDVKSTVNILALSPEIEDLLDSKIDSSWSTRNKLKALRELLYSKDQLNIHYDAASTLTAVDTFQAKSGNCLSLTSLFIASARHVGLDAEFKSVAVDPTWDHEGKTMIRYEHIIATGKLAGGRTYAMDFLPEFMVEDMRTKRVSDEAALSLYFNNLGAEGIVDGRIEVAVTNLRQAIILRPQFSDAWSNMGAAMRRYNQYDLAEFSYLKAIDLDDSNYSAMSNLVHLYTAMGRDTEADIYSDRVDKYRSRNPYFLYFQAQLYLEEGKLDEASQVLKKSIRIKRDEPEFYISMSKIHEEKGEKEDSLKMLATAEKYREGVLRAPERRMNHRFWTTMTIGPKKL